MKEKGVAEVIFQSNISAKKIATTVTVARLVSKFEKVYLSIISLKSVPVQIRVFIVCLCAVIC